MTSTAFYALSDEERDYWIADWELTRLACPDCGRPMDECSDPKRKFYPYRRICWATMEQAGAQAAVNALRGDDHQWHDGTFTRWAAERSDAYPYPAGAGEVIGVADTDMAPWDKFTTRLDASPVPPSPGEQHPEPSHADDRGEAGEGHRVSEPPLTDGEGDN